MNAIHEPAVAGSFYPGAAAELSDTVAALLDAVQEYGGPAPKALIVPHAGYIYSGPTAAAGYARLQAWSDCYERVILLGPCHQVPMRGLAASGADAFSLEVHLPFLQAVLGSFELIPIVVGDASYEEVADVLDRLWGGPETLIVISSDLSHYHPYDIARARDHRTCAAIEHFDPDHIDHEDACGATPVGGVETIDLRNSGDTAGDKHHVVGYGAWAFVEHV